MLGKRLLRALGGKDFGLWRHGGAKVHVILSFVRNGKGL